MIRFGLISDVHANLPALQAVLQCLDQERVDAILSAGDLVAGPHPNETIHLLRQSGVVTIRGNTDSRILDLCRGRAPDAHYHMRQFALARWSAERIAPEPLAWLEGLPEELIVPARDRAMVHIAHCAPGDPDNGLDPIEDLISVEQAARKSQGSLLVVGHSHQQWSGEFLSTTICNPGAVCGPLDGTIAAQYAVAEYHSPGWKIDKRSVRYDLAVVRRDFVESGLMEAGGHLARAFLCSIETGRDVGREFLELAYSLAGSEAVFVPDEAWDQAAAIFPWPDQHA